MFVLLLLQRPQEPVVPVETLACCGTAPSAMSRGVPRRSSASPFSCLDFEPLPFWLVLAQVEPVTNVPNEDGGEQLRC